MVPLPKRDDYIEITLNNQILMPDQYKKIMDPRTRRTSIYYSGDFNHLSQLIRQLSGTGYRNILLRLMDLKVDNTICLPFELLDPGVQLAFVDSAGEQSNFYNYLVNANNSVFNGCANNIPNKQRDIIATDRTILTVFLKKFRNTLLMNRKNINDYTKTELMNYIFDYVCDRFHYDNSMTKSDGQPINEPGRNTYDLGGTAAAVVKNRGGVCEGRSKLVKLLANNKELQVPCYLAEGKYINPRTGKIYGHVWNEYINERGKVYEYDTSFGLKCRLEDLPSDHDLRYHEPDVAKRLK